MFIGFIVLLYLTQSRIAGHGGVGILTVE